MYLGLLGFFKYADFAIAQFNILGQHFDFSSQIPLLDLALPIGISFYTFHSITYTVSIFRGQMPPAKSFVEYGIFVAFFPQLVAGPILRAKDFLPQLREKIENFEIRARLRQIVINNQNLKLGITLMAFGLLKKMFFADNIAPLVNNIFSNPVGMDSFTIILGTVGFGIQIYCDFSGYTDIAIGAALVMGLKMPINFNKPYFATSPSDFWRRWHISLSSWLRDYLYIPLGGNKKSKSRTYLNLAMVMFLGGLWHGASWNFVIWGMLHGVYLALHKFILDKFPFLEGHRFFKNKIGTILSIFITQYFVFLAWIAFRVKDTNDMIYCIQKYIFLDIQTTTIKQIINSNEVSVGLIGLFIMMNFILYKEKNMLEKISLMRLWKWFFFIFIITLVIFLSFTGNTDDFMYFDF